MSFFAVFYLSARLQSELTSLVLISCTEIKLEVLFLMPARKRKRKRKGKMRRNRKRKRKTKKKKDKQELPPECLLSVICFFSNCTIGFCENCPMFSLTRKACKNLLSFHTDIVIIVCKSS